MNGGVQEKLWSLLNQRRSSGRVLAVADILTISTESGIVVGPEDLWSLGTRIVVGGGGEYLCPPAVASFIVELLHGSKVSSVLDSWSGYATLLRPVVEAVQPTKWVGVVPNNEALGAARVMLPTLDIGEYRIGSTDGSALRSNDAFDLIVSVLPFGVKPRSFTVDGKELRDAGEHELLLRSASRLKSGFPPLHKLSGVRGSSSSRAWPSLSDQI